MISLLIRQVSAAIIAVAFDGPDMEPPMHTS